LGWSIQIERWENELAHSSTTSNSRNSQFHSSWRNSRSRLQRSLKANWSFPKMDGSDLVVQHGSLFIHTGLPFCWWFWTWA
jgi:hypothetical protein